MNKEDCFVGQRVKINPYMPLYKRLEGLTGTIKELPLGYVIMEIQLPILASEIEPVVEEAESAATH